MTQEYEEGARLSPSQRRESGKKCGRIMTFAEIYLSRFCICICAAAAIIILLSNSGNAQTISIVLQDVKSAPYTTWAIIPAVPLNTASTMSSAQGVKVVISSAVKINLSAKATSTGAWTAGLAPGANVYKLELKAFAVQQTTPVVAGAGTTTVLGTTVIFDPKINTTSRWVYAKLTSPTGTISGQPQVITVTITATAN